MNLRPPFGGFTGQKPFPAVLFRFAWPALVAATLLGAPSAARVAQGNASLLEQWLAELCGGGADQPLFSSTPARPGEAARPMTKVTVLSCEPLPDVPGKTMTTTLVEFPPRAYTPAHRHPGSVTAFVVEGTVRSQLEGGPAVDYTAGATWFEAPRELHLFAENPDPVRPAKLLATFVTDRDCGPLTIPEPKS
ncbi:cupin domain-containing protein [Paraburkholderia flava]|uniref:cupin domain-containing protein n=1 Tax=Paraburkholderia flava TaxID=2547393 RepID=UPI0010613B84|nr:cupin domain-containing protein [Paraburkholderia flava]